MLIYDAYNNGAYDDGIYRVGDDCSDFAMAVILRESGGNRGQTATLSTASREEQRGLQLHETNTELKPGDILMTINDTWKHTKFYYGYQ